MRKKVNKNGFSILEIKALLYEFPNLCVFFSLNVETSLILEIKYIKHINIFEIHWDGDEQTFNNKTNIETNKTLNKSTYHFETEPSKGKCLYTSSFIVHSKK